MCCQESVTRIKGIERPEVAEAPLPRIRLEIGFELLDASSFRTPVQLRKARNARTHTRIKIDFWSPPKRCQETIDTVMGDWNLFNAAVPELTAAA